ncbi:Na(+)-translocating NADH-quinone reductase subunit B [bioreactor metagenome]|jgi:Na+-transporting NADH:ubiquinone oxidoreductase subunit B|uniref:Na+-transporting NADH:ubiquinone oxidoreductase subunit B n=2 Tax=root TaxID=1 RepID=A0A562J2Z8_9FIRM|nr:RnfABCDGE type electron transport complex subunit D [Sedimentibacter saalensis]MEA5096426.1 RnfABCDGE type electron transport complex subunit D [Sedimentibacter saalensis]TWH77568.1 Na+-transporting NADH:ubiquinone oxidoreductase subunit B [Sedimentibacter saalensis]
MIYKDIFKVQKNMRAVLLSLVPIVLFSIYIYGQRVLVLLILVTTIGTAAEYMWEKHYGSKASEAVFVTCILYTMTLPPSIPMWIAAIGILFGLFFGKLFFGGFGRNIFNPALVGRAFIYVNFPEPMTISWNVASGFFPGGFSSYLTQEIDAVSSSTPMIMFKNSGALADIKSLVLGTIPGAAGETCKILIIISALYLIYKKTASHEIMLGSVAGFSLLSIVMKFAGVHAANPLYGMMMGGFLFGTVYMATDPISAAKTKAGKWIYGLIIGAVTILIRSMSLFNGGMMFAILIGNTFAPIIDYFVKEAEKKKKEAAI